MGTADTPLGKLYSEAGYLVLRRCMQILANREEALDVVQWTFVRALEVGFEFRSRPEALVWLYRTASRRCLQVIRRGTNRARLTEHHRPALEGLPPSGADERLADRDLLLRALDRLSDAEAQMVLMTYVWGFEVENTAEICGVSERTVRRARETFQTRLAALAEN